MSLSRIAAEHAAEIRQHDWSDAPWRADRAGHDRRVDTHRGSQVLSTNETDFVRLNVMWTTAQVIAHNDPNFDIVEFAEACGVAEKRPGVLKAGLRQREGVYDVPGTWEH